ncbi:transposase [Elysia marginata]|uniref:Transposase n=1 Tax=Elysia marginata TaxID=1093978 RepID=A0AAV4FZY9_9GAST|nr:transposase [Elysia marginata]
MAFNLLANLTRSSPSISNSSPVDAEEGELDESDIENGREEEEEGSGDEYRPSNAVTSHRSRSRPRPTVEETEIDDTESVGDDGDEESRPTVLGWNDDLKPVEIEMFTERVGPRTENFALNHDSEPIQYFSFFFPDTLIENIAEQTNLYATQKEDLSFKPVTSQDIQTFLYINMMFGIHQLPAYTHYWSLNPWLRVSQVADVMSRNRLLDIRIYIKIFSHC